MNRWHCLPLFPWFFSLDLGWHLERRHVKSLECGLCCLLEARVPIVLSWKLTMNFWKTLKHLFLMVQIVLNPFPFSFQTRKHQQLVLAPRTRCGRAQPWFGLVSGWVFKWETIWMGAHTHTEYSSRYIYIYIPLMNQQGMPIGNTWQHHERMVFWKTHYIIL